MIEHKHCGCTRNMNVMLCYVMLCYVHCCKTINKCVPCRVVKPIDSDQYRNINNNNNNNIFIRT